jgi:hypothetical protein
MKFVQIFLNNFAPKKNAADSEAEERVTDKRVNQ